MSKKVWITLGVIAGTIALVVGTYVVAVAVSGPKGVGDAIIKKNSAENWTAAQARFEDLYAGIEAADAKIALAAANVEAAVPDAKTAQQTYTGLVSGCLDLVGDYNADARKFLAEDFRASDLPAQIDGLNPTTDCKE